MSISASEKEDWAESERDRSDSEGPADLQEELIRVMNKAVPELELSWNPPEEPTKSKLDSWYFRSSRRHVDPRTSVPFFPDGHDQLVKTWSAPQSARVHSATQAMFSHVDGAEAHGYVRMPPVEETVQTQNVARCSRVWHSQCLCSCMSFNKKAYILTKRALSSSLSQCDAACPASEQCRAATHTGYSRASLDGASVDRAVKAVMSVPEHVGSYSGDLALATRCDKARIYPSLPRNALVLRQEVCNLLGKGTI